MKLSRHSTGRLISIKNISKWRESTEVRNSNHPTSLYILLISTVFALKIWQNFSIFCVIKFCMQSA